MLQDKMKQKILERALGLTDLDSFNYSDYGWDQLGYLMSQNQESSKQAEYAILGVSCLIIVYLFRHSAH